MTDPVKGRNAPIRKIISQKRLKDLLSYDPDTGFFSWRIDRTGPNKAGCRAGNYDGRYRRIRLDDVSYYEHRLAFIYMIGKCPDEIDHVDCDKQNNVFANLRGCNHSHNNANRIKQINNTSGYKGVTLDKSRNRWIAQIAINGKHHHLGRFRTVEEADFAYQAKAKQVFGNFVRTP